MKVSREALDLLLECFLLTPGGLDSTAEVVLEKT